MKYAATVINNLLWHCRKYANLIGSLHDHNFEYMGNNGHSTYKMKSKVVQDDLWTV